MEIRGSRTELLALKNSCTGSICSDCALRRFCKSPTGFKDLIRLVEEDEKHSNQPTIKPILIMKGDDENASNI